MNIDKNNYEAFFLDYHEGNLSPQEVADLYLFLSQYPELKKEFEDFEHIVLEDFSAPVFENKDSLKKNITADNREEYFIRAVENTLDPTELALLNQFLKTHPEFLSEFNLFIKTKLQADTAIVFDNKTNLKQLTEADNYLISALEGVLSSEEKMLFEKQLASDQELQKSFRLYQQTTVIADASVVYPNRCSIKSKEKKFIPLYYYVAIADSLKLLVGMFFLWRKTTTTTEQPFAEQKKQPVENKNPQAAQEQSTQFVKSSGEQKKKTTPTTPPFFRTVVAVKNKRNTLEKSLERPVTSKKTFFETDKQPVIETTPLTDNPIVLLNAEQKKQNLITPSDSNNLQQRQNIAPDLAQIENKPEIIKAPAYRSLRDILATRLKEELVGKDELEEENKNYTSNKISGWDIAGAFAKGLSKVTGKKIEIKPQYNSEGNVTAYALSAGKLEFSRVK